MDKAQPSELVELRHCPPGVFEFDGSLGFKTEYGMTLPDENGANMPGDQVRWKVTNWPDAYCLDSGETFWGGAKTHDERARLLVRPIDLIERLTPTPEPCRVREVLVEAANHLADEMDGLLPYLASHSWRIDRLAEAVTNVRSAISASPAEPEEATEASRSLVEQLRYHQGKAHYLAQQIAGDPCQGVIIGPDGHVMRSAAPIGGK